LLSIGKLLCTSACAGCCIHIAPSSLAFAIDFATIVCLAITAAIIQHDPVLAGAFCILLNQRIDEYLIFLNQLAVLVGHLNQSPFQLRHLVLLIK